MRIGDRVDRPEVLRTTLRVAVTVMGLVAPLARAETPRPEMVADLYPGLGPMYSVEQFLGESPESAVLAFSSPGPDLFVWASDGSASGVQRVARFPGWGLTSISAAARRVDRRTFFMAHPLAQPYGQLWVSDGKSTGTHPVTDRGGRAIAQVYGVVAVGSTAWILGCGPGGVDCGLWSVAATRSVAQLRARLTLSPGGPVQLVPLEGALIVRAGADVWALGLQDGKTTLLYRGSSTSQLGPAAVVGGRRAVFSRIEGRLHSLVSYTAGGPRLETLVAYAAGGGILTELMPAGSRVFFGASEAESGQEIWSSDGTREGTRRETSFTVRKLLNRGLRTEPGFFAALRDRFVFWLGNELWSTASGGEGAIKLLSACDGCLPVSGLATAGSQLVFGRYQADKVVLWSTDGTPTGTTSLLNVCDVDCAGGRSMWPRSTVAGAFFERDSWLWRTDGTQAGTEPWIALNGSIVGDAVVGPQRMSFMRTSDLTPTVDWIAVDLHSKESRLLHSFGPLGNDSDPNCVRAVGRRLAWSALGSVWSGPLEGGEAIPLTEVPGQDFCTTASSSGRLFYVDSTHLWAQKLDGSPPEDLLGAVFYHSPLTPFEGGVVFPHDGSLWFSDGTSAGTTRKVELPSDVDSLDVRVAASPRGIYFAFEQRASDGDLWLTDLVGTPRRIARQPNDTTAFAPDQALFHYAGGSLVATNGGSGLAAVRDGSLDAVLALLGFVGDRSFLGWGESVLARGRTTVNAGGLYRVSKEGQTTFLGDLSGLAEPGTTARLGSKACFIGAFRGAATGTELWCGASPATIRLVKDILPGPGSGVTSRHILGSTTRIYFGGFDQENGAELWGSDGTASGTRLLFDIQPGAGSSAPEPLAILGGYLYFVASDGPSGRELWRLRVEP